MGQKLANPRGLHDMHGNVAEWVLDAYEPAYSKTRGDNPIQLPNPAIALIEGLRWPTQLYPRGVRGGSFFDDPEALRSARRQSSERDWKMQDPELPKSVWYHADAFFVGFRVVRPAKPPVLAALAKYWPRDDEISAVPRRCPQARLKRFFFACALAYKQLQCETMSHHQRERIYRTN